MKVTKFIVTASAVLMCTSTVFAQTPSTNTLSFYDSFITRVQAESKKDPFVFKNFDKAYVTFCLDDGCNDIDYVAKIFDEYGYPLCLAVPPTRVNAGVNGLSDHALGNTVADVMKYVESKGGEILCHSFPVITAENINDKHLLTDTFINNKKLLTDKGFKVRGIILAGGANYVDGKNPNYGNTLDKWVRANFDYSDLYGNTPDYYYPRRGMNSIEQVKGVIDEAINNKTWKILYTHQVKDKTVKDGTSNEEVLRAALQYWKDNNVQVVPYKYIYDNFSSKQYNK